jgi:hypothetical protein
MSEKEYYDWNYVYFKFEDVALELRRSNCSHRKNLSKLINQIFYALRDIQNVDDGDAASGEEIPAIIEAFKLAHGYYRSN